MVEVNCSNIGRVQWREHSVDFFVLQPIVAIWHISISQLFTRFKNSTGILSQQEQMKAENYSLEKDRQRYLVSRIALRTLLGKYLQITPADIRFATGINNKPKLFQSGTEEIHFNLSHSGDVIVIAVAALPVGIDIEHANPLFDFENILSLCFSSPECDYILKAKDPQSAFYLLWTRKEAILKAIGKGIDNDIKLIPCLDGKNEGRQMEINSDKDIWVGSFCFGDDYACSVAHSYCAPELRFYEFDFELLGF